MFNFGFSSVCIAQLSSGCCSSSFVWICIEWFEPRSANAHTLRSRYVSLSNITAWVILTRVNSLLHFFKLYRQHSIMKENEKRIWNRWTGLVKTRERVRWLSGTGVYGYICRSNVRRTERNAMFAFCSYVYIKNEKRQRRQQQLKEVRRDVRKNKSGHDNVGSTIALKKKNLVSGEVESEIE